MMTLSMKLREERRIGDFTRVVSSIRSFRGVVPYDKLISGLKISQSEYDNIVEHIDQSPEKTDEDIAEEILGYGED